MIKQMWSTLLGKFVNRETVSYFIFGVLTTAVDWVVFFLLRQMGYTAGFSNTVSWAAAVLFAYVTNKIFVFQSRSFRPGELWAEFVSFVLCRALTGAFTVLAMIVMVDWMGWNDVIGKILVSALSLVLNYVFSKLFIFKEKKGDRQ